MSEATRPGRAESLLDSTILIRSPHAPGARRSDAGDAELNSLDSDPLEPLTQNSGGTATYRHGNSLAVKLARMVINRFKTLPMWDSFHGALTNTDMG